MAICTRQPGEVIGERTTATPGVRRLARLYLDEWREIVGSGWARGYEIPDCEVRIAEVNDIAVFQARQGTGFGTATSLPSAGAVQTDGTDSP